MSSKQAPISSNGSPSGFPSSAGPLPSNTCIWRKPPSPSSARPFTAGCNFGRKSAPIWQRRLIWGVNDLDEAWPASYALDLVRLTTSAYLAISGEHLSLTRREAAEAIEEGYRDALEAGGKAFVLAEHHQWLRLLATSKLRDPVRFWAKMQQCPPLTSKPPQEARKLIEESLPPPCRAYQLKRRIAGLGSLGHPRILALSSWQGAFIAREAKGIRTSAAAWCRGISSENIYGAKLVDCAIRVKDPCVRFHGHWLVRRLEIGRASCRERV